MTLADLSRESVLRAIGEFNRLGRTAFLEKYGFGPARSYVVVHDGHQYDSKAIAGAAHGYATGVALTAADFSGGAATVQPALEALGFRVVQTDAAPSTAGMDEGQLRDHIMRRLEDAVTRNGGVIHRKELSAFDLGDGTTRRLVDQSRGIWNPQDLSATLSIISSPDGPYDDKEIEGGLLRYDYRAGSTQGDNAKLRRAMETGSPIILLRKIATGVFVPIFPVFVVADDHENRQFVIALDESQRFLHDPLHLTEDQRRYAQRIVKQRLHQPEFRGRVIRAYDTRCTVCSLRHGDLLDAAHIVDDGHEMGHAVVQNGLSLCKIHHAAFDRKLMGIDSRYTVHINSALLEEVDGPMLKHGLQEMHKRVIQLPNRKSDWPDPERLGLRWQSFVDAS